MADISKLDSYIKLEQKMKLNQMIAIEKAMSGDNPDDILKANSYLAQFTKRDEDVKGKYDFIDPHRFESYFGYKEKPLMITYNLLRAMSRTPIINIIIRTRLNQVGNFSVPQQDMYSNGFVIRKKRLPGMSDEQAKKLTLEEEKEIYAITEFLLNCGVDNDWTGGDFETFLRKLTRDSLTFDQYTFETVFDRAGRIHKFYATDSSTIRISDSIDPEVYELLIKQSAFAPKESINGYYPSFVQIFDNRVVADFYPWEMCFGVRNPVTDINSNGYGVSEIEEMVAVITSLLWGHEYNRNIFRSGTTPKGFLKVSGNLNPSRLAEFRQMWYATMRGVQNTHRTPVFQADKVDWVDLQQKNRDMEYHQWMEFNIKLATGIFSIDPAECNFPMAGEAGASRMFEAGGKFKIENSKDKGLYPLLRNLQKSINRNLIRLINPKYEFVFTGMDALDPQQEQKLLGERIKTYMTVNEVRAEKNLEPLPDELGGLPLDPTIRASANFQAQTEIAARQGENVDFNEQGEEVESEEGTEKAGDFDIIEAWEKELSKYNLLNTANLINKEKDVN